MSSDFSPELQAELLDDFYAECDEHLTNLRTQLAKLQSALASGEKDATALESLYRSVHSFKGNAGIIGLQVAETLAHAAEDLLRPLSRHELPLTPALLDLIGQVGHRLEQIVGAFRLKQPLPDTAQLLDSLAPYSSPISRPAPHIPPIERDVAPAPGVISMWRATFAPSEALDQRGVNLNTVRARLATLGEIVRGVPSIQAGGKMTFDFTLAVGTPPTDLAAWATDGIVLRPDQTLTRPESVAPATAAADHMSIAPSHIVRVDLGRLDDLMRIVGELVIHRSRLEERIGRFTGDRSALQEVTLGLGRSLRELREGITRVRLVPVAEIFGRLPFVVRDLERDSGKQIKLKLEGEDTEIDKYLVERLKEPLLHLVRNAVSHGIETPAEREAAGKPAIASLRLRAWAAGDAAVIQIRDDGRGLDAEHIVRRAREVGVALGDAPDARQILDVLCTPGFSTRDEADRTAGRGVGMAVVASTLRELGGTLTVDYARGQWTEFTLRLPLTLSIAETFIVSAGGQTCAVPQSAVDEIIQVKRSDIRMIQGVPVAPYRDGLLPLSSLRMLFAAEAATMPELPVLVVGSDRGATGLIVDRVHGQREVVVRPMRDELIHVPGISGATELGDGKPVLILDAAALTHGAVRPRRVTDQLPLHQTAS